MSIKNLFISSLLLLSAAAFAELPNFVNLTEIKHAESNLSTAKIRINQEIIDVELAQTDAEKAYGLMNRENLPQNEGMLFIFDKMQPLSFWMKNTKIPLDILYFDDKGRLVDYAEAVPCKTDICPSYPSKYLAQYVLEIGQGERERLKINIGDQLEQRY